MSGKAGSTAEGSAAGVSGKSLVLLLMECILSQSRLRVLRAFRTRPCSGTSEWKQWNQPVGRTVQVRLASLKEEREQEEANNLQLLFAHERSKVGLLASLAGTHIPSVLAANPACVSAKRESSDVPHRKRSAAEHVELVLAGKEALGKDTG